MPFDSSHHRPWSFRPRSIGVLRRWLLLLAFSLLPAAVDAQPLPALQEVSVISSLDGEQQPVRYWAPANAKQKPTVLFVFLHSWSSDYKQDNSKWLKHAVQHGWIFLHPNFRGANLSPKACGSKWARQDVLDAMNWAAAEFQIDDRRVYLCGVSGGGHMAMLMAGHHPDRFSAVSAWVGISDLADWYRFHRKDGKPQRYAQMILKCFGQPPGFSKAVDDDYKDRSPLFHLHQTGDLPIDIWAGVNDGHSGSVPVSHSLKAFNRIAETRGADPVTDNEMQQLWTNRKLDQPQPSDLATDPVLGRELLLRRTAGPARVTIFDGGHESIPAAAVDWLQQHQRPTEFATRDVESSSDGSKVGSKRTETKQVAP